MKLPKYPLASSDKLMTFEFISEGKNGLIHKLVRYQPTNLKDVYNLAFGDKNSTNMKITAEIKKRKIPIVRVDASLNEYDDKILFPDKLERANEMLRNIGLPKQWTTANA